MSNFENLEPAIASLSESDTTRLATILRRCFVAYVCKRFAHIDDDRNAYRERMREMDAFITGQSSETRQSFKA